MLSYYLHLGQTSDLKLFLLFSSGVPCLDFNSFHFYINKKAWRVHAEFMLYAIKPVPEQSNRCPAH